MAKENEEGQTKEPKEARTDSYLKGKTKEEGEIKSIRGSFDSGWDVSMKAAEEMELAAEQKDVKGKKTKEKPCSYCPEDKPLDKLTVDDIAWEKVDMKSPEFPLPIKRDKKIEWINNEAELKEFLSKNVDYTKKTQELADERRKLESEYEGKAGELTKIAESMSNMYETLLREGKIEPSKKEETKVEETKPADIFARFDLDEDLASESEKKMAMAIAESENKYSKIEEQFSKVGETMKFMLIRDVGLEAKRALEEAKKQYPIEEITDNEGNNLTWQQFETIFIKKVKADGGQKKPIPEIAVEAYKEIYDIQQRQKEKLVPEQVKDDMSPEDFAAKFPGLYEKITKTTTEKAVADHEKTIADLPPSLSHVKQDVSLSKTSDQKEITGIRDAIKKGFSQLNE